MFVKVSRRALPTLTLVLSSVWATAVFSPLFYSLLFPTQDIQNIVRALEGRETLPETWKPLIQVTVNRSGQLRRAIQVSASYSASSEYTFGESHTTRQTALSYLAWFEKRPKPTILVIERTEIDGSQLRFNLNEGRPVVTFLIYFFTVVAFACSAYWFRSSRSVASAEQIESQR